MEEVNAEESQVEEYPDDDFEASSGSEEASKVSISRSGRLPPLSSSFPLNATNKSLSNSIISNSQDGKIFSSI